MSAESVLYSTDKTESINQSQLTSLNAFESDLTLCLSIYFCKLQLENLQNENQTTVILCFQTESFLHIVV